MIAPHGGTLVNRVIPDSARAAAVERAAALPGLVINHDLARDAQNIARGVFSPLTGFIGRADFESLMNTDRLVSGAAFTIPIMLDVPTPDMVSEGEITLYDEAKPDVPLAIMEVQDIYPWDKTAAAQHVFGTVDPTHPGVGRIL